jgi:hypothetical protein
VVADATLLGTQYREIVAQPRPLQEQSLGNPRRWPPARVALFAVGALFGFLVLADGQTSTVPRIVAGLTGAVLGTLFLRERTHAMAIKTKNSEAE